MVLHPVSNIKPRNSGEFFFIVCYESTAKSEGMRGDECVKAAYWCSLSLKKAPDISILPCSIIVIGKDLKWNGELHESQFVLLWSGAFHDSVFKFA